METANLSSDQYLDAPTMNYLAGTVASCFETLGTSTYSTGLIHPELASVSFSGLTASVSLPAPFGVIFGSGILAQAHGTTTNADTQTYSVSFSGVVPISGTIPVYLLASYAQIQQNPIQIVGPPPGNPNYDPTFSPYTAYQTNVDSLALAASTTPADNSTTFEILRGSVTAAVSGVAGITTAYQRRAIGVAASPPLVLNGVNTLTPGNAGLQLQCTVSGIYTLPSAASCTGLEFSISCIASGASPLSVQVSGTDTIYGYSASGSGTTSFTQSAGDSITLGATTNGWQVLSQSATSALQQIGVEFTAEIGTASWFKTPNSNSPTGYFIRQIGPCSTSDGFGSIVFPMTFPNALIQNSWIVGVVYTGGGVANDTLAVNFSSVSTSGMQIVSSNSSSINGTYTVEGY